MGGTVLRSGWTTLREFILKNCLYIALGAAVLALAAFAFVTNAPSYAGTVPATCANCHVMDSMYENYYHGGHHAWAVCADCHLPHANLAIYYIEKARQGMHDVYAFGMAQTPEVINLSDHSKAIVQQNCLRCHESTVESITVGAQPFERHCWDCHRTVAHGVRGASAAPYQDSSLYPMEQGE